MTRVTGPTLDESSRDAEAQALFAERVERYQDAAFATAYALLKDRTLAEDATQAAFLTAWLRREDLRDPNAFGGWLRSIVRTESCRILRRKRVPTVPLDDMPSQPGWTPPDPSRTYELREVLLDGLAELSESDRSILSLRYMSDMSYGEMAEYLALPLSTIKKRLHDARKRLQAWFKGQTATARARALFREYRPSHDRRLEQRLLTVTQFLTAVARHDVAAVERALDDRTELRDAKGEGRALWLGRANALTVAVGCGHIQVVKALLARGAPIDPATPDEMSPVATAAIEARTDIVKMLLDAGATVDIFAACAMGDGETTNRLLADNPALARIRHPDGKTPLHFCRSVEVAAILLEAGAREDLNAEDDANVTPLQWIGATGRHKDVCRYLISQGATTKSNDILFASAQGDVASVRRLLDQQPALVAARVSAGSGFNAAEVHFTPLHLAAARGEREIAALLIARGAEVDARGGKNRISPLHAAAAGGDHETAEELVAAGADVTARDGAFRATPSEWARFFGHATLASWLEALPH